MFFFHIMYSNIHSVALLPLAYIAVEFLANHMSSSLCCYGSVKSALDQQKRQSTGTCLLSVTVGARLVAIANQISNNLGLSDSTTTHLSD